MNSLPQSFREPSLHYIDAQACKIENSLSLHIPNSEHPCFGFVFKGSIQVTLAKEPHQRAGKVAYGEVFLLPTDCSCTIQNNDKQPAQVILIRFQWKERGNSGVSSSTLPMAKMEALQLLHFRMPRIRGWIQDLLHDGLQQEPSRFYLVQSYLYAIAAEFMEFLNKPKVTDDGLLDYVTQIKQNMLEHCSAVMDIDEMARLSGFSYARFYQVFKRQTGLSPLQFMTIARLNESLRLLANHPSSIMEVAHAVGYTDELYFSRLFKKHMGLAPTEYAGCAKVRVANLCPVFRGDLSVLGITPVLELSREWYDDPNKEKYIKQIEHCRPELILTAPVSEEVYRTLSQICPVVMIQWKGYSWKERLHEISLLLGVPTVAEYWLSNYEKKVDNARSHLHRHLGEEPFLVVSVFERFYRVYGMQRIKIKDLFYDELKLKPPASAHEISFLDVLALDEVAALDCNSILFLAPSSLSTECCSRIEEEWLSLKRNRRKKHCVFIRHEEPLLYNAAFYESLIDQCVNYFTRHRG